MKRKLLVTIIAIVLVIAVTSTCFALYEKTATEKVINLSATAEVCTLTVGTSTSLDFAGISPSNRTKTVDVTLSTSDNTLVDGVHGIFKVALSGDLASSMDVAVNAIASVGAESLGAANADALTESGANIALSAVPQYFRVTISLKEAITGDNFGTIAEQTGAITISWTVDTTTVFAYNAEAYYVVGTLNGVTAWYPTANSIVLNDVPSSGNQAMKLNVTLHNGDSFKVVKNHRVSATWYSGQADNSSVAGVSGIDGDGNVQIDADGSYDIYVNDSGAIWVAVHGE